MTDPITNPRRARHGAGRWKTAATRATAALATAAVSAGALVADSPPAAAITGTYTVALVQTSYADATVHRYTQAQLRAAAGEIQAYFWALSNHKLTVQVRVGLATLTGPTQTMGYYSTPCQTD